MATLGDPAVETDLWVGQACVTAAGRYVVVVYAPEQAANMAEAQGVLGDAAIVNLRTGAVKDLGGGFSIAYFDPGCGTGSDAVLTKGGWANDDSDGPMSTTLVVADAATGKVSAPVKVAGQVTSAVPFDGQIAAAGWALARSHARTGRVAMISGYLGSSDQFDLAIEEFAVAYADQNQLDYQRLLNAIERRRLPTVEGL